MQSTQTPQDRRFNASAFLLRAIVLAIPTGLLLWAFLAVRF